MTEDERKPRQTVLASVVATSGSQRSRRRRMATVCSRQTLHEFLGGPLGFRLQQPPCAVSEVNIRRDPISDVSCPRCSAPGRQWVRARDRASGVRHTLYRCTGCGVGFTWPAVNAEPAAPTLLPDGGILRRVADALTRAELDPVFGAVRSGGAVLDIGAGSGNRALILARAGYRVTAVEPDAAEAALARRQLGGRVDVHECAIEALPASETGYDGAVLSHVLEHLADPDATLRATRQRLRPGGALVVFVPNAESGEARLFRGRWHGWEPSRHRWHYAAATLTRVLVDAGYVDIDVRAQGGWRSPATLAFSAAPRLDPQIPGAPHHLVGRALTLALAPVAGLEVLSGHGPQLVAVARGRVHY